MLTKAILATFAATACAAASLTGEVPAQAQPLFPVPATPSDCDWIIFATDSYIKQSSGHTAHVEWGNHARAFIPVSDSNEYAGPVQGPIIIKGTNELDFSITANNNVDTFTNSYTGTIDPNGSASGGWHNDQGGSGTWTMDNTFKCVGRAPVQGGLQAEAGADAGGGTTPPPPEEKPPTDAVRMTIAKQGFSVKVTVTSTADIPGQCTYDANEANGLVPAVHRDFDIAPKGTEELTFPAPLPLQAWRVVVACSGDFKGKNVEFGRQVQNI